VNKTILIAVTVLVFCSTCKKETSQVPTSSVVVISSSSAVIKASSEVESDPPENPSKVPYVDSILHQIDAEMDTVTPDTNDHRLSQEKVEAALASYPRGKKLATIADGENACNGQAIEGRIYQNGFLVHGSPYNTLAQDWFLKEQFHEFLGLHPGMRKTDVLHVLEEPHRKSNTIWEYLTETPTDEEDASKFESIWKVYLQFEEDELKSITLRPNFDDC